MSDAEFQTLAAQLSTHRLRALSGYNPIPGDLKLVGPDLDRTKQEAHIHHLLARASALTLTYVILKSGASWRVHDGFPADEAFGQLAAFGRHFAAAAAQHGITVLVEPLRGTDSNMITTVAGALGLVNAVNHLSFEMMVDYSFLTIQNEDAAVLLAAGSHLKHGHLVNPAAKRTYPMDDSESDYASFFKVLKQMGNRDGLSVHASTPRVPPTRRVRLRSCARAGADSRASSNAGAVGRDAQR